MYQGVQCKRVPPKRIRNNLLRFGIQSKKHKRGASKWAKLSYIPAINWWSLNREASPNNSLSLRQRVVHRLKNRRKPRRSIIVRL